MLPDISVFDVIDVVKRVSGVDFEVGLKGRRAGDPAVLVASNKCAKAALGWTPRYYDLESIVRHALAWERKLPIMIELTRRNIAAGHDRPLPLSLTVIA
jgi:UDP-glucose 4-epimerase